MRRTLLASALLLGCNEHETASGPLVRSTEWLAGSRCDVPPPKVDVLLVIDDSPSMAAANEESDALDLRGMCKSTCEEASIDTPWLERATTPDPAATLACLGQLGVSGCALESPIGAAWRALDRAVDPSDPAYGFLRPDAGLSIVFIGDEDDCSRPDDDTTSLVDSAGCLQAAMDGGPTLLGLDTFRVRLEAIERDKQRIAGDGDQRVFVSAVAGTRSMDTDPRSDCGAPVRIRELVAMFDPFDQDLVSVCDTSWGRALACLPGGREQPRPFCIDRGPLGFDEHVVDVCIVVETQDGETRRIPPCEHGEGSTFQLPEGVDACAIIREWEDSDPSCYEREEAEVGIMRSPGLPLRRCIEVVCATEL